MQNFYIYMYLKNYPQKYVKQKLTKLEVVVYQSKIIVGDFSVLFSGVIEQASKKISKHTEVFE